MTERLVIAGFGGQGIMFLGKLIAWCAMREEKFVTFMPAYGAEVRGGTSHCSIIISDSEIASPCVDRISTLIVLNKPSFLKFFPNVRKGTCVFANTSLIESIPKASKGIKIFAFPFTDLASRLGNARAANMIILGAYLAYTKILKVEDILKLLPEAFKNNSELIRLNESAVREGAGLVNEQDKNKKE